MTDYKILVQQVNPDGTTTNVWASEIRNALTMDEAVGRFFQGYDSRPDRDIEAAGDA